MKGNLKRGVSKFATARSAAITYNAISSSLGCSSRDSIIRLIFLRVTLLVEHCELAVLSLVFDAGLSTATLEHRQREKAQLMQENRKNRARFFGKKTTF